MMGSPALQDCCILCIRIRIFGCRAATNELLFRCNSNRSHTDSCDACWRATPTCALALHAVPCELS